MLSSEMARNFNIVHSQFKQIVKEHNDMVEKLNNNFKETIQHFRDFGILDVERDKERNNEFYRLITRNQEIRGNLYMEGDIHLKGKIIREDEKTDNNDEKISEALLNSFSQEVKSQISDSQNQIEKIRNQLSELSEVLSNLTKKTELYEDNSRETNKSLSSLIENNGECHDIFNKSISQLQNKISLLENHESIVESVGSNIVSLVYTPTTLEEMNDNTININWEEWHLLKPFSVILYDFSFFPNLEVNGDVLVDGKKLKIELVKSEDNERTTIKINKSGSKFVRIDGFIADSQKTIITSTTFL